jgi:hypothetical protein
MKAKSYSGSPLTIKQEEYLIHARSRATPYRQIAIHLHKTELACRLHYHQMTFGAHRRQSSVTSNWACSERSHSPRSVGDGSLSGQATPAVTFSSSPSPSSHFSSSPASTSTKSYTSPASSVDTEWSSPRPYQQPQAGKETYNKGIGLTWQHAAPPMLAPSNTLSSSPDLGRLLYDYADNNRAFWSNVANQFSQSPAELEAAFHAALGGQSSSMSPKPDQRYLAPLDWASNLSAHGHLPPLSEPQNNFGSSLLAPSPKRFTVSSLLS